MTAPTGRPVGRPAGSRDFRPFILKVLERHFCIDTVLTEWKKLREKLSPREKLQFDLELMKLGVTSSPKTVDVDNGTIIRLIIGGLEQKKAIDAPAEIVQNDEPAGTLPPAPKALLPHEKEAIERRARTYPQPKPRTKPAPRVAPASPPEVVPPVKGPIFTVPTGPPETPREWRTSMEDLLNG